MDAVSIKEAKYKTQSILGVINDTIEVGIAKIKGEESAALEVAIIKATLQDEVVPKEKHVQTLLEACLRNNHGDTVDFIILGLYKRLEENTKAWLVTLKTLIVFHRLMRESTPSFQIELLRHGDGTGTPPFLPLESFDDHTTKDTSDYSRLIRVYSAYLNDRLATLRLTRFDPVRVKDIDKDGEFFKTVLFGELLQYVASLQRVLGRLTDCIPEGAAQGNEIAILACSLTLKELDPLYSATKVAVEALLGRLTLMGKADADQGMVLVKAYQDLVSKLQGFLAVGAISGLQATAKFPTVEPLSEETILKAAEYAKTATKDPPKPTANLLGFQSFLVTPNTAPAADAGAPAADASPASAPAADEPAAEAEPFDPFAPPPSPPKPPADPLDKVVQQVFGGALEALELAVKQEVAAEKEAETPETAAVPATPTPAAPSPPAESPADEVSPAATASPAQAAAPSDSASPNAVVEPPVPVPAVPAPAVAAAPTAAAAAEPYVLNPKDPLDSISTVLFGDRTPPPQKPMRLSMPGVEKQDAAEATEPAAANTEPAAADTEPAAPPVEAAAPTDEALKEGLKEAS
ncbi:hypothetical protein Vretimale_10051 [Volvox reticuliferus]|uniref:ENTH domain-containing protein n=1 Tax=Volvox reticuliferus TaxID=1737510 RepID=A0A8J4LQK7_9CHLO|nr:hypothetical protein Vretifemale_787 [Volvox reticuliferus]GIM05596.1 hypothetical protein Vretimale_10051 [Volvox reticuliferus]